MKRPSSAEDIFIPAGASASAGILFRRCSCFSFWGKDSHMVSALSVLCAHGLLLSRLRYDSSGCRAGKAGIAEKRVLSSGSSLFCIALSLFPAVRNGPTSNRGQGVSCLTLYLWRDRPAVSSVHLEKCSLAAGMESLFCILKCEKNTFDRNEVCKNEFR